MIPIAGIPFKKFNESDLVALVENKVPEGTRLDYKQTLELEGEPKKHEFRKDIVGFANSAGGAIIYGVSEERDENGKNTGLPGEIVGLPDEVLTNVEERITHLVRSMTDPTYASLEFSRITHDSKNVLIVGIQRSPFGPHAAVVNGHRRFYMRISSSTLPMETPEIRRSILESENRGSACDLFRRRRLSEVWHGGLIPNLRTEGGLFVHLFPLSYSNRQIDFHAAVNRTRCLGLFFTGDYKRSYNLDGRMIYEGYPQIRTYLQLFRDLRAEYFSTDCLHLLESDGRREIVIRGDVLNAHIVRATYYFFDLLKSLDLLQPVAIALSLVEAQGRALISETRPMTHTEALDEASHRFDRNEILAMPSILEIEEAMHEEFLREPVETLWQSAGWPTDPFAETRRRSVRDMLLELRQSD